MPTIEGYVYGGNVKMEFENEDVCAETQKLLFSVLDRTNRRDCPLVCRFLKFKDRGNDPLFCCEVFDLTFIDFIKYNLKKVNSVTGKEGDLSYREKHCRSLENIMKFAFASGFEDEALRVGCSCDSNEGIRYLTVDVITKKAIKKLNEGWYKRVIQLLEKVAHPSFEMRYLQVNSSLCDKKGRYLSNVSWIDHPDKKLLLSGGYFPGFSIHFYIKL